METGSASEQSNDYLDFELEIEDGMGREYPVHVIRSVAGEAREIMYFPFDTLVLENRLLTLQKALLSGGRFRRIPSREEQTVQDFGQALFNALFTGEVRSRYAVSQREAHLQGKGLRIKLRIRSPEMATLPWEFLYDAGQAEYICLSRNTPIVRYIELPQPPQPLTVTLPLRILVMIVSPQNLSPLDIEREKLRIERATEVLQQQGLVSITWLQGQTWQALQQALAPRRGPWHVFHFIGHGGFDNMNDEGLIAVADKEGYAQYLSATHLARLLVDQRSLRLVLLNSCEGARGSKRDIFSSTASILVRRGIPAVLAMQYEITDIAAVELSHAFYQALADNMPVDMAVGEARKAISLGVTNTIEWGTPVLYMRSPDGTLFNIKERLDVILPNRLEQVVDNLTTSIPASFSKQDEIISLEQKQGMKTVSSKENNIPNSSLFAISPKDQPPIDQHEAGRNKMVTTHQPTIDMKEAGHTGTLDTARTERGKHVLVVDDSPSVRRIVSNMLKQHGWEVQMARDGVEALEIISRETPAAVLLDIEMPRMDGYELIAIVRAQEQHRTLPLIMLTSRVAAKHQQRAMQLGATAYLVKPYQDEELLNLLNLHVYGTPAR